MNEIYEKYGEKVITDVISDYILYGYSQEEIAMETGLNQWSDISAIVRGCNFNSGKKTAYQSGKSRGAYANERRHCLKNGAKIPVTYEVVNGFVRAWNYEPSLTFSQYMERTYGGKSLANNPNVNTARNTPSRTLQNNFTNSGFVNNENSFSDNGFANSGNSFSDSGFANSGNSFPNNGFSNNENSFGSSAGGKKSSTTDDDFLSGCGCIMILALAVWLLPKIPLVGGLFQGLFGWIGNLCKAMFGGMINFFLGLFWNIVYTIAAFGEIVASIGLIVIIGGKILAPNSKATKNGGIMMCFGMALMSVQYRSWISAAIFALIGVVLCKKK